VSLPWVLIDLAVQIIPLHVTDDLAVHVQLMQVTAAVVQVIDLASIGQGRRGQVAQRVVLITQRAIGRVCDANGVLPYFRLSPG